MYAGPIVPPSILVSCDLIPIMWVMLLVHTSVLANKQKSYMSGNVALNMSAAKFLKRSSKKSLFFIYGGYLTCELT